MRTTRGLYIGMVALDIAVPLTASSARLSAQQNSDPAIRIGNNDLERFPVVYATNTHHARTSLWHPAV
jgi:hypothetical protein